MESNLLGVAEARPQAPEKLWGSAELASACFRKCEPPSSVSARYGLEKATGKVGLYPSCPQCGSCGLRKLMLCHSSSSQAGSEAAPHLRLLGIQGMSPSLGHPLKPRACPTFLCYSLFQSSRGAVLTILCKTKQERTQECCVFHAV